MGLPPQHRLNSKAWPYGLTVFLSAFLLFLVEPLMGKYLLPWFGGASAVWTTCLLFFQALLLAGYAYAHTVARDGAGGVGRRIHLTLLAVSLAVLALLGRAWATPITPGPAWRPESAGSPTGQLLLLLLISVGLPFFLLASTGPLLQAWFSRRAFRASPYRLYALSNFGSLLALLAYPFLIEWTLTIPQQAWAWSGGYVVFALSCAYGATRPDSEAETDLPRESEQRPLHAADNLPRPSVADRLLTLGLAFCASVMLLATTNQLCLSTAAVPLLWILPLGLYLLSFMICFHDERWYVRGVFQSAFGAGAVLVCLVLFQVLQRPLLLQIAIYSFALFAGCMVCHGELFRLRPAARYLTGFYLTVAAGGALGGVFVSLLAPIVFKGYWEFHTGLEMTMAMMFVVLLRQRDSWIYRSAAWVPVLMVVAAALLPVGIAVALIGPQLPRDWRLWLMGLIALTLIAKILYRTRRQGSPQGASPGWAWTCAATVLFMLGSVLLMDVRQPRIESRRNFYGVLNVTAFDMKDPEWRAYALHHGDTLHGFQFLAEDRRRLPTAYYAQRSGVGLVLEHHPRRKAEQERDRCLRIGAVGLGIGTIAAYGQPCDYYRFYELNPEVARLANSDYFSFLKDSPARIDTVLGDGRLSLERELEQNRPQAFDVLALDAFAGDAIPVHLLTREAFGIYLRHLRQPEGILAIHITNRYLNLQPVIWKAARDLGLQAAWVHSSREGRVAFASDWMLVSKGRAVLDVPEIAAAITGRQAGPSEVRLWTDNYSNLFQVLIR
ncbi:MAG: ferrichrome ABC transporter permease [Terriglobia bacterium]